MSDLSEEIEKTFDFCSSIDVPGTFIPCHLSMFINRISNIALWESVYVHETIHSLLTDTLNGWWIQLLEDISNNMFVVFRRGDILDEKLISWILNLEFKRRKLMESWMQTQEGFATYFQLDVMDIEKRAVAVAAEIGRLRHHNVTDERVNQIKIEVKRIREEWLDKISSRSCHHHYWRGYELVTEIAKKFGKENLAPVAMAACSIRFPDSLVSLSIDSFQEVILQEKYNVDKRLEAISRIPDITIKDFPLVDDWMGLTQKILQHLGEKPLKKDFDFLKMIKENYTHSAFPKEFIKIAKAEMPSQFRRARKRWKNLTMKGIDSSQLVAVFNVVGEAKMMSNFEPADSPETDEVLAMTYRVILNGLDKLDFINDLLKRLRERNKLEGWMEALWGSGDLARFEDMFPFEKLLSLEELCLICHNRLKYSNRGLTCPYSNVRICTNCCVDMKCLGCAEFITKRKIVVEIERVLQSFAYKL